jgi:hypothetical protein
MPLLFHQNLRDYGGGAPLRTATFTAALGAIGVATGPLYWAAGFTEVLNAGAAPPAWAAWPRPSTRRSAT